MLQVYKDLFQDASATFISLVVLSIVVLGVGLERWFTITAYRRRLRAGVDAILAHLLEGKRTMAQAVNVSLPRHPATAPFERLLDEKRSKPGEIRRAQSRVVRGAKRRLWVLGSAGSIAPFVGLFGTVIGVMEAFRAIGAEGAGGFAVVSSGISEALITTAAGIAVGVEAVLAFNYLQVNVTEYAAELREAVEEIQEAIAEEGPDAIPRAKAG